MTQDLHSQNKALFAPVRQAMYAGGEANIRQAMSSAFAEDCVIHLAHPFGDMIGPEALWENAYGKLASAWPDWERRDHIIMAGPTDKDANWIGCGGYYLGTFTHPFLQIPPTGAIAHMRFHEFYRFENGKIVEMQALWDIPEVFHQAGAWPLAPSLGREWHIPSPATQDGLLEGPRDPAIGDASCQLIVDMLEAMKRHPKQGGRDVMEMEKFWHPKMMWYGPTGIGSGRGIDGFRNWHQIPFLAAMPDRGQYLDEIEYHFFGEGNYAAVTGWPNMIQTHTHDGWLGLPPTGKRIEMRSLDFWRIEDGRIRENWVMVDLLHMYDQLGLDVFARLAEFNKARSLSPVIPPSM